MDGSFTSRNISYKILLKSFQIKLRLHTTREGRRWSFTSNHRDRSQASPRVSFVGKKKWNWLQIFL